MSTKTSNSDSTTCPACGSTVKVTQAGKLAKHDWTPDDAAARNRGKAEPEVVAQHCRWSGESVDLIEGK